MEMISPKFNKQRDVVPKPGQEPGKKTVFPMFKGFLGGNSTSATTRKTINQCIVTSSSMKGGDVAGKTRRNSKLLEEVNHDG